MEIPEPVLNRLIVVFQKEDALDKVFLFGSRARGDHKYNSDIDLAIQGNGVRETIVLDIKEAAGLYKVDVLDLSNNFDKSFMDEFIADAILIYEKEQ